MFPRLFTLPSFDLLGMEIPPFTLHTYGVLLALAFLAGLWAAGWQARKAGLNPAAIADMGVYVLIAGVFSPSGDGFTMTYGNFSDRLPSNTLKSSKCGCHPNFNPFFWLRSPATNLKRCAHG